jgi:hypothetical protein
LAEPWNLVAAIDDPHWLRHSVFILNSCCHPCVILMSRRSKTVGSRKHISVVTEVLALAQRFVCEPTCDPGKAGEGAAIRQPIADSK